MPATPTLANARLFYTDGSPYARMARMALRETGLIASVEEHATTVRDPQSTLLQHSPVGRVPSLVLSDGTTLVESFLIITWLDSQLEGQNLIPRTAHGLSAHGQALGLLDGIISWNRELRRPEEHRSQDLLNLEKVRAERIADALEKAVADGGFQTVDAAYIALSTALGYIDRRHTVWQWRATRPALKKWMDAASQRPAFMETVPQPSGI